MVNVGLRLVRVIGRRVSNVGNRRNRSLDVSHADRLVRQELAFDQRATSVVAPLTTSLSNSRHDGRPHNFTAN